MQSSVCELSPWLRLTYGVLFMIPGALSSHEHSTFQNLHLGSLLIRPDVRFALSILPSCFIFFHFIFFWLLYLFCLWFYILFKQWIAYAVLTQGTPTLEIGNHLLEGKFESLKKPMIVCQRNPVSNFDVRGVCRKKLIFKTRPHPIVTAPFLK